MAAVPDRPRRDDFVIRRLEKPEEFRAAEELANQFGSPVGEAPVPVPLQRTVQDNGGLVLGAFSDIYLAGFTFGFLGWDGQALYLYSQLTAVRTEYQNHHVGRRLKLRQREEVLALGLGEIRGTFDPLNSHQALLEVRRLGAVPDRYLVHYYGRSPGSEVTQVPSDRLRTIWKLNDPRVEQRLSGKPPTRESDLERWNGSTPVLVSEVGEQGLRRPVSVEEPSAPRVHIEIPFDIALFREHEPDSVLPWRHAVRDAFRSCFDLGYAVDDFAVVTAEHERRSYYFLSAPRPQPPTASGIPPPPPPAVQRE